MLYHDYFRRLRGCYTGKAVGGTLGMPLEGYIGTKKMTYYDPVPTTMIANDDIDLQVVWLEVIRDYGLPVCRRTLARGWEAHMRIAMDEYAAHIRNLKSGLYPPLTGSYDNKFTAGMGSIIRTEIWAGLAPGDPSLAVRLALEDACCDHYGDGIDATVFFAALESAAYAVRDVKALLDTAFSFIPPEGRFSRALHDTLRWWEETGHDPYAVREKLLHKYYVQNWTDVSINVSFILLGWLDGELEEKEQDRVSRGMCTAVSLGHDADCTGASLGSLLGILYPDGFEERWTKPLGDTLLLSSCITGMHEAATITEFCEQIAGAAREIGLAYHSTETLEAFPEHLITPLPLRAEPAVTALAFDTYPSRYDGHESLLAIEPFAVRLYYPRHVAIAPGECEPFRLHIAHPKNGTLSGTLTLSASAGWKISPAVFALTGTETELTFTVTAPTAAKHASSHMLYLDFETGGLSFRLDAALREAYPVLRVPGPDAVSGDDCPGAEVFRNAVCEPFHGFFEAVPAGGQYYAFEIRNPAFIPEAIMLAQASRPVTVWMDGKLLLRHDGTEGCPAFHRTENIARLTLDASWHTFIIHVAKDVHTGENFTPWNAYARVEGCPTPYEQRQLYDSSFGSYEDGELFFGFATHTAYEWLHELSWRIPTFG